ncbi:MAG: arginyltransferase [Rhodospirillales bacterium]|jgi:arginine-tRNA-protein transferase|nr:arginyltransferase [Rhodospirillaceae bacterium]MDP6427969.1 arginyltransferase [Rhodospirillales bacterium]MDP6646005.1 arginyltransferase [Rhodospirillales bacterium]MDP6841190.1 arginyltransferase [Rhodospirillales bacterium]|tara:strand:+ start:2898 stop:3644 length:747 start_codon:yes stop_codon:yes gene_type:complete
MKHNLTGRPTPFFVTAPLPCPYLSGETERRMVAELTGRDSSSLHDTLSRVGFRRSHGLIYAPICQNCSACKAVRTVVDEFEYTASQKRVMKINRDIRVKFASAKATTDQFQLFSRYQDVRHTGGDMATMDFYDYQALIEETPVESIVVEFRDSGGDLIGTCLVDRMSDGLSAVYSFFDPNHPRRSPGTYMILWLIERARTMELPYVYLGYWIEGSSKMSYKQRFNPLEYYTVNGWSYSPHPEALESVG